MTTAVVEKLSDAPPAGAFYPLIPSETYHRWDAMSSTLLKKLATSPAHLAWERENYKPPTPSLIFGDLVHVCVLEPERIRERFAVSEQCCETTGKGARCSRNGSVRRDGKWYCSQHDPLPGDPMPVRVVSGPDMEAAFTIADNAMKHPAIRELMDRDHENELSGLFDDPTTGELSKIRVDRAVFQDGFVIDLKTTVDASESGFKRAIINYNYDLQQAFYEDGCETLGKKIDRFFFVALESEPPYCAGLYEIARDDVERARDRVVALKQKYQQFRLGELFNGYSPEPVTIHLPDWAQRTRSA